MYRDRNELDSPPCLSTSDPLTLTAGEASALVGVSVTTFRRLVRSGDAPAPVRIGRRWVFRRADILNYVEALAPRPS
ncbi:MAG: helix-turn-helix domain-containing protein [Planctomycetes bacterium]|nr:helix-turn-helix domain-containing protein [Planctomycetota bacterium]